MVVTLQRRSWVRCDRADRYHLSSRMFELAHRNRPVRTLVEAALPVMQGLARQSMQSCHLVIVEGGRVLVIAQVEPPGILAFGVRTGAMIGLLDTASGLVLLAFRSPEERVALIEAHALTVGEADVSSAQWKLAVTKVLKLGYAMSKSSQVLGVTNISYPIWGMGANVVAALCIPYMDGIGAHRAASIDQANQLLNQAASEISAALGYQLPLSDRQ